MEYLYLILILILIISIIFISLKERFTYNSPYINLDLNNHVYMIVRMVLDNADLTIFTSKRYKEIKPNDLVVMKIDKIEKNETDEIINYKIHIFIFNKKEHSNRKYIFDVNETKPPPGGFKEARTKQGNISLNSITKGYSSLIKVRYDSGSCPENGNHKFIGANQPSVVNLETFKNLNEVETIGEDVDRNSWILPKNFNKCEVPIFIKSNFEYDNYNLFKQNSFTDKRPYGVTGGIYDVRPYPKAKGTNKKIRIASRSTTSSISPSR